MRSGGRLSRPQQPALNCPKKIHPHFPPCCCHLWRSAGPTTHPALALTTAARGHHGWSCSGMSLPTTPPHTFIHVVLFQEAMGAVVSQLNEAIEASTQPHSPEPSAAGTASMPATATPAQVLSRTVLLDVRRKVRAGWWGVTCCNEGHRAAVGLRAHLYSCTHMLRPLTLLSNHHLTNICNAAGGAATPGDVTARPPPLVCPGPTSSWQPCGSCRGHHSRPVL